MNEANAPSLPLQANVWHRRFNRVCWHRISKLFSVLLLLFLWLCFLLSVFTLSTQQLPFFSANAVHFMLRWTLYWPALEKANASPLEITYVEIERERKKDKNHRSQVCAVRTLALQKRWMLKENHRKFKSVILMCEKWFILVYLLRTQNKKNFNTNSETEKRWSLISFLYCCYRSKLWVYLEGSIYFQSLKKSLTDPVLCKAHKKERCRLLSNILEQCEFKECT